MEKVTLIMSSVLPVPATKGGAVENLLENIAKEQESEGKLDLNIISAYDSEAYNKSKIYTKTNFNFVKVSKVAKCLDKLISIFANKILKKENIMSYSFICQRLDYYKKISKMLSKKDYGKIVLENSAGLYLCLKWKKNYIKYKDRYYYHCHNAVNMNFGCEKIIKNTKKFIGVSKFILNDMTKNLGDYVMKNSVVLRNCVDDTKFKKEISNTEKIELKEKYNIKDNEKVLLFVGRLTKEKGVLELLQALQKCNIENIKLLVVGSFFFNTKVNSKFEKELKKFKDKLNDKIIFTGFVNYDDIYKIYKIADISILPSIWDDPAPLTIIESLTCGIPIITTYSGGIPEYAINNSAIIINRGKNIVNDLAKKITLLLNDKKKINEMKLNCLLVSKEFTLNNYYKNFVKIMEE